ncbi:MAG: hypothetical protein AAB400_02355 [Patescibacteria group bacterium]
MTSRLMLVVALFGIFASATVTFAQLQQPQGGQLNQQQGGQQGQYQGQMPPNQQQGMMGQYGGQQGQQGQQYGGQQQGGQQGQMPPGGFDPNMDPSRKGQYQGQMPPGGQDPRMMQGGGQDMQGGQYGGKQGQQGQQYGGQQQGGGQGQMPPGGPGMMQGPGKEFFSRMVTEMKSNMKPFEMMVKNFDKQITKVQTSVKKCGISPNFEEMKTAVTNAKDTVAKVKNLDPKAEDLDFSPEEIGETAQTVSENQRQLMQYDQFCRGMTQREKDLKGITGRLAKIERNIQKGKLDLTDSLNEQRADLATLQTLLKDAKDQASQDIEKAMDTIDDFEDKRNDVFDRERALQMAANFSRELKNLDRDAKRLATDVKNEKRRALKKKLPSEDLSDSYTKFNDDYTTLKGLAGKKNVDPEDLIAAMEDVFDARRDIDEALNQLREGGSGKTEDEFALPQGWDDIAKYSHQGSQQDQMMQDQ